MPRYTQKITAPMDTVTFTLGARHLEDPRQRAFVTLLFLSGCRVSEALALTGRDVRDNETMITVSFHRLKGSKQTEPIEIPRMPVLFPMVRSPTFRIFPWSRKTGYRIVQRAYPGYYPHFFRMNRITALLQSGVTLPELKAYTGLSMGAIEHYVGHVGVKRVGVLLQKEVGQQ